MLIPLSDGAKTKVDAVTVIGALFGWLKLVPWPEIGIAGKAAVQQDYSLANDAAANAAIKADQTAG